MEQKQKAKPQPDGLRPVHAFDSAGRGLWYAGAPAQAGAPVLVFVPGLGQPASCFWGKNETYGQNEMYQLAARAGYRTAFVGFQPPHALPADMWQNAKMLAWQLSDICAYFHVPSVTLIAHSKGGVDAQTAVVYHGAARFLRAVYTLSSPHGGSQLADIAYSTAGFPLARRLGMLSDGCFSMQTGYMRAYRAKTDPAGLSVPFFTFAGDGSGPALSRVWAGGQLLSLWGANDGVVTVASAHGNPNAHPLGTLALDHIRMMSGQYIWPHLRAALEKAEDAKRQARAKPLLEIRPDAVPVENLLLRGGETAGDLAETFDVDSGTAGLQITLLAAQQNENAVYRLTMPGARETELWQAGEEYGARVYTAQIERPVPGRWKLYAASGPGAYFASVRFEAEKGARPSAVQKARRFLRIFRTFPDRRQLVFEGETAPSDLPEQAGIYSVEQVLRGELPDGSPYERCTVRQLSRCADGRCLPGAADA